MLILLTFINPRTNFKLKSQKYLTANYEKEPNWFGAGVVKNDAIFFSSLVKSSIFKCCDCT